MAWHDPDWRWRWKENYPFMFPTTEERPLKYSTDADVQMLYNLLSGQKHPGTLFISHSYLDNVLKEDGLCVDSGSPFMRDLAIEELLARGYLASAPTVYLLFISPAKTDEVMKAAPTARSSALEFRAYNLTQKGFALLRRGEAA